jgi:tetratricopeptide (TPR) repeat protein
VLQFAIKGDGMRLRNCLLIAASLAALAACASVPDASTSPSPLAMAEPVDQGKLYGLYLAGHKAIAENHAKEASDYFARAAAAAPDASLLKEQAFLAALNSGDIHRAALLAPGPDDSSLAAQRLGRLTRAVDDLALKDGRGAEAVLSGDPLGPPHRAAGVLLLPWAAAAAGDWKTALTVPDTRGDPVATDVAQVDLALLYEHVHRNDDAETLYKSLVAESGGAIIDALSYGEFLERRGRRADADAVYATALKNDPTSGLIQEARARVAAQGRPPAAPTYAQGAAQALLAPAAAFLAERQTQYGLPYLELILDLDPSHDEAWVLLGESLLEMGDIDAARAAFEHPAPTSPQYVLARGQLILTYQGPDDAPKALEIAQETVKALPNNDDALALLADSLRVSERYDESAKVLDTLIAHQGDHANWQLYYMRGVAYSQADQWPLAEQDLEKAMTLKPDDPELLNFLGYSWVDRGERLPEARALIEKAAVSKPDSGAIIDSLGWVDYKLGDYKNAVLQLERAATLEAADPDINDHLGDAYWRAGRRTEARFQWDKVLTLSPSPKLRAQVTEKIKSGLGAAQKVDPSAVPA